MVRGVRTRLAHVAAAGVLAVAGLGFSAAVAGASWGSKATEVSTLRSQATRFVTAELNGDGATTCAVLNAPLSDTVDGRTCAQRWDASLHTMLRTPGERQRLRGDLHAIPTASIAFSDGDYIGEITLPTPLLGSSSRFYWTANCWMLER